MKILSKSRMLKALLYYELIAWTGYIPGKIHNMELHIPVQEAKFLWGWPDKFMQRMEKVNTQVVLVQYQNGWSDGFDSEAEIEQIPEDYSGGIWTNRIDIVGPLLERCSN